MRHHYTDPAGNTHTWETPDTPTPLDPLGALATLIAVLGLATPADAANAVGLTPDDLINEAQAWAVASENNQ